jgi:predicted transcriptional regulator
MSGDSDELLGLTTMVASAYVKFNRLPQSELAGLIVGIHSTFVALGQPTAPESPKATPAIPIKRSITPDAIYSLEDGRPFKSLKRHLRAAYDLSPDEYRQKWGLPADYPMVAPNYAESRARLAKSIGLGRREGGKRKSRR